MTTPKPRPDLFTDNPRLISKKCRTSTPTLRPPKPPMKSTKSMRRQRGYHEHQNQSHRTSMRNSSCRFAPSMDITNELDITQTSFGNQDIFSDVSFTDLHEGSFSFGFNNRQHNDSESQSCRLFTQFDVIGKIGSGDFADVYEARSLANGQHYAIKRTSIPFTSQSDRLRKLQEVRNHQLLPPHPNCVRYHDSWEEDGYLYIQTELCKTSLNGVLENCEDHKLPERLIWDYLMDMLQAIKHLHDHDLIHMDIKPDNIFISYDGAAKLGDFGNMCSCLELNSSILSNMSMVQSSFRKSSSPVLSNNNNGSALCANNNLSTTALFSDLNEGHEGDDDAVIVVDSEDAIDMSIFDNSSFSHQQLTNDHNDSGIMHRSDESIDSIDEGDSKYLASETMQGKFTKAADIFSLGISIFEIASGLELPKQGKVYHKLRHNEIDDLYFNGLSADLVKIIKLMMEEDYTKRPTVDELLAMDIERKLSPSKSASLLLSQG